MSDFEIWCRVFLLILFNIIVISVIFYSSRKGTIDSNKGFGITLDTLPVEDDIDYFRDIPFNKDFERIYYVAKQYHIQDISILKKGMIGMYLLKWIRNNYIKIISNTNNLEINNEFITGNRFEKELFEMFKEASKDNIIDNNEFNKWARLNYYKLSKWFDRFDSFEKQRLIDDGLIFYKKELTNKKSKQFTKIVDEKVKTEAVHILGLKKFLLDFSSINDRLPIEVKLWDDYLLFSEILGISKAVNDNLYQYSIKYDIDYHMFNIIVPIDNIVNIIVDVIKELSNE